MPCTFHDTGFAGLTLIETKVFDDDRGYFLEAYKEHEFSAAGIAVQFVQDNISSSRQHVLRGLHFQCPPRAQGKLVRALAGAVFDVAVDIRPSSPTYRQWYAVELSAANRRALYVPVGFAHGFVVVSTSALVLYKTTEVYSPGHDGGIRYDDPAIGVRWPVRAPVLSAKDAALPPFAAVGAVFA
ncbi:MAG: dTDP-4-dehydrorhamnose 3,5-epimerase [Candidatus Schekmanbacteria bacterium]|nr:dTDP-4-dehydrorhamnose 3,5-epimerase [Candidatus Schekmanbacteria bacterium]